MGNIHRMDWIMVRKLKNMENETHTVGPGIWPESVKNVKYEKYTRQDMCYDEKTKKRGK